MSYKHYSIAELQRRGEADEEAMKELGRRLVDEHDLGNFFGETMTPLEIEQDEKLAAYDSAAAEWLKSAEVIKSSLDELITNIEGFSPEEE